MHLLITLLFILLPREIRAVWFTTTAGLDWPEITATTPESRKAQQMSLCRKFDSLQHLGINTILFQVRSRCATDYPSKEPWERTLSGSPSISPGYDPLAFAIKEAHQRHMQLHAWVVCFGGISRSAQHQQGRRSLRHLHPSWFMRTRYGHTLNPGIPAVREYLTHICTDLVHRYDIDGIHLDYIRYPERSLRWNDYSTYKRYGRSTGIPIHTWRKQNITKLIQSIRNSTLTEKPWITLSVSAVGKYDNISQEPTSHWTALNHSQDVVKWLNEGLIDVAYPMIYFDNHNFYPFAAAWREEVKRGQLVAGLGIYFHAPAYGNRPEKNLIRQLQFIRNNSYNGYSLFRTAFLLDNIAHVQEHIQTVERKNLGNGFYDTRIDTLLPPPLERHGIAPLAAPKATIKRLPHSLLFNISLPEKNITYNIYRITDQGLKIVVTRLNTPKFNYTPAYPQLLYASYVIASYDRYGREVYGKILKAKL